MKRRNFVNARGAEMPRERRIYGIHPVTEWLRSRPGSLRCVHYDAQSARRIAPVLDLAAAAGVPVEPSTAGRLAELAATARHQGVVATAGPFPYADLADVVGAQPRLLIVVDQMQDPHNLGALLRTAAAAGAGGVILPRDGSVSITPTVEAAAAGAAAIVPVCQVTNAARTLHGLKQAGYWTVGLTPRNGIDLYHFDPPDRMAIVIGGETGMRPLVARSCDFAVSVPMEGRVESLNASVAAAVVLYEVRRRWHPS